ncbi:MAG: hypothetical protein HQL24_08760 [Candidatus Omnitrophica bacterium]|nr:hypothetical protein [Candidatus Omnitrophota bacterium]
MAQKKNYRRVEFKYEFDRLGKQKMEQAYDILLSKFFQECENDIKELVHGGKKQ